jgi:predicted SprT family Zn-dependent metalloprotease
MVANEPVCTLCQKSMTKVSSLNSGNAKYVTYRCGSCRKEQTVCIGVGK